MSRASLVGTIATLALGALAAPASGIPAQGASRRAPRCTAPDTTKEWFGQQRAWLDESKHDWSNDTLRQSFLRAAGMDGSRPVSAQLGFTFLDDAAAPRDSAAAESLRALLRQRGATWPTRSVIGAAGVRAVWLLAVGDSALEASVMRRMMEAGLGESFEADVAVLEDRVRARGGRSQLYGTVMRSANGVIAPLRIEDSSHVDLRRDAAGLPTLRQSVCAATRVRAR